MTSVQVPRKMSVWSCCSWVSLEPPLPHPCLEHPQVGLNTGTQAEGEVCQTGSKDPTAPYQKSEPLTLSSFSWFVPKHSQGCTSIP